MLTRAESKGSIPFPQGSPTDPWPHGSSRHKFPVWDLGSGHKPPCQQLCPPGSGSGILGWLFHQLCFPWCFPKVGFDHHGGFFPAPMILGFPGIPRAGSRQESGLSGSYWASTDCKDIKNSIFNRGTNSKCPINSENKFQNIPLKQIYEIPKHPINANTLNPKFSYQCTHMFYLHILCIYYIPI